MNFLNLDRKFHEYDRAKVVVLGIPYEATTTYGQGTKNGPQAILKASAQLEIYDEELDREPCRHGIATCMPFDDFGEPSAAIQKITEVCSKLLADGKFVVGLGGEHTVSVGLIHAHLDHHPNMWVLQLDAHSDLREIYEGSRWNHACTMARVREMCPYVGVGIRSGVKGERRSLSSPAKIWYAHEMHSDTSWPAQVLAALGDPVYVTIDLDYFDPSVVPSVGTPEPGGFHWVETLSFLRKIATSRRIVGFDVMELSPRDGFIRSDFHAAKLVYKLLGYVFADLANRSQ